MELQSHNRKRSKKSTLGDLLHLTKKESPAFGEPSDHPPGIARKVKKLKHTRNTIGARQLENMFSNPMPELTTMMEE
jgi:hypothetical protein